MASNADVLIDYLKQCEGNSATVSDIINKIGVNIKVVFKVLRELKKNKQVWEDKRSKPTKWSLCPHSGSRPQTRASTNFHDLEQKILELLNLGPKTAIRIAKEFSLKKPNINQVLYKLKRDQIVVSNTTPGQGQKPVWCLSEKAMASDLFRDSRNDTCAPGAYSPEKSNRGTVGHGEKQSLQHRHQHRAQSNPYDAASHRRSRTPSGSGQNVPFTFNPSTPSKHLTDSGIVTNSGNAVDVSSNNEGTTALVAGTADQRNAATGSSYQTETDNLPGTSAQSHVDNIGDDSFFDDDDDDYDFEDEPVTRFQNMMGDLMFTDMTYMEDEEMPEADDSMATEEDLVLVRISLEPDQCMSLSKLAKALDKAQEEVHSVLSDCSDKVGVSNDLCSLTESGKATAKEVLNANPSLADELNPHHHHGHGSVSSGPMPQTVSHSGPPLPPMQLIEMGFGRGKPTGGDAGVHKVSPGRPTGMGRGQNLPPLHGSDFQFAGDSRTVSGTHDVRDLEARPMFPLRPSSLSSPPFSPMAVTSTVASSALESDQPTGGFRNVQELDWKPLVQAKSEPSVSEMEFLGPSLAGLRTAESQGRSFSSMPTLLPQPSLNPMLQRFSHEGLTVIAKGEGRGVVLRLPDSQGLGSGASCVPATPMEQIERRMGKAGLSMPDMSFSHNSRLQLSSGPASMPASMPAGESSTLKITSESFAALNKNPISALMEYAQSRRMQAIIEVVHQRGPSHRPVFVMAAKVGNRQFTGVTCHNKKDGRKEAADVALRTLIAEGQYSAATPTPSINVAPENMTHFDKIAALTHQTFNTLIASIPENLAGRKVIAGLVMKRGEDDVGMVISIGTGNRCITGDKLSLEGNTVNDSHAEIITRRGFMRFLYQQLEKYEVGRPHDLFEPGGGGRLRVKSGITFHLYISTAPCGDGALFSPRDVESNSGVLKDVERKEHNPTFTSNVQGLLRTKMEGGEGTIPVDTKEITVQTWDGVVRGERLRTMSCTDKICRWNVLGLQGALLSHFVEPVYLDSLTLGFLYDHGHLSRAVCCRLTRDAPQLDGALPSGYHLNHPWLGRVTACQPLRETQKTKAFSINWTIGDQKPEVLDGTLGHCYTAVEKRLFSRVAKRCLYDSFKQVAQHLGRADLLQTQSYRHSKMAAQDFQRAKGAMISKFQQMGCGWVRKPVEEEMFS